jgi:hypothetical protein
MHWERWHWTRVVRPVYLCTIHVGGGSSSLSCWSFPPTTTFTGFPAPDYWVVLQLLPAAMFVYSSRGKWVFPPLLWSFSPSATLTSFPTPGCWACALAPLLPEPLWPAQLVYLQSRNGFPSPNLRRLVHSTLFPGCLICSYCLLLSFSFFPGWKSVCPGGYAALAQACLWEYRVPQSSPGLRLPKPSGRQRLAAQEPSWFLR